MSSYRKLFNFLRESSEKDVIPVIASTKSHDALRSGLNRTIHHLNEITGDNYKANISKAERADYVASCDRLEIKAVSHSEELTYYRIALKQETPEAAVF